jgi:hypothetical protein
MRGEDKRRGIPRQALLEAKAQPQPKLDKNAVVAA